MKKIVIATIATMALSTVAMAEVNGKVCASCHGASFEKKALGKSNIVAELTHAEIAERLKGYKNGTYGASMKSVMKGQIGKYSDEEIDAFALTIGK